VPKTLLDAIRVTTSVANVVSEGLALQTAFRSERQRLCLPHALVVLGYDVLGSVPEQGPLWVIRDGDAMLETLGLEIARVGGTRLRYLEAGAYVAVSGGHCYPVRLVGDQELDVCHGAVLHAISPRSQPPRRHETLALFENASAAQLRLRFRLSLLMASGEENLRLPRLHGALLRVSQRVAELEYMLADVRAGGTDASSGSMPKRARVGETSLEEELFGDLVLAPPSPAAAPAAAAPDLSQALLIEAPQLCPAAAASPAVPRRRPAAPADAPPRRRTPHGGGCR